MRIIIIGQAVFAEKALEALHTRGEEIVHVFAPPDSASGRADPVKLKALALGLPSSQPASFRSEQAYEHFKSLEADLAILAFVTIIVPERILYAPRLRSICFHPSLLPRHRGASAINWAIIQGDEETGTTWFWPDKGIDTGPILLQRRVKIGPDDTTGSLYFNRLFPLGIETLLEALDLIKAGNAPAIPQDEKLASYEPICRDQHARIDFSRPARDLYNLVRGCDPQPGAFAKIGDRTLRLFDVALKPEGEGGTPGTIVAIDALGMRLELKGATMLVRRVRIEPQSKKVPPAELAAAGQLVVGSRLE